EVCLRFARGESSYRAVWKLLARRMRCALQRHGVHNPLLRAALHDAIDGGKRLAIVFGDRDPELTAFRELARHHAPPGIAVDVLPDTSHGFVTTHSMTLLREAVRRFVADTCVDTRARDRLRRA